MYHPASGSQCRVPRLLRVPVRLNICNYNSPLGRLRARIRFTLANNSHPSLSFSLFFRPNRLTGRRNLHCSERTYKIHGFLSTFERNRQVLPKHATISVLNSRWPLIPGQPPILQTFQGRQHMALRCWPLSTARTSSAKTLLKVSLVESGKRWARSWFPDL